MCAKAFGGVFVTNDNLIYDEMSERIIDAIREMVTSEGVHGVNVSRILKKLGITNRVFYNRFHNIEEVLGIISESTILKVRESIVSSFDKNKDFFEQIMEIIEKTLRISYDTRMKFAHYVFENDSLSTGNYEWWMSKIKWIITYAMDNGYIRKVDLDMTAYAIWCFIKGFNTDAIGRNLPLEEALKTYRYGFSFILKGLKA